MEISAALTTDIDDLTASIGSDPTTIRGPLAALVSQLKLAVLSYAGLRLTVHDHGHLVTLTAFEDGVEAVDIQTTVRVRLTALSPLAAVGSAIVFYARTPGAFVDLAADLGYALQLPLADGDGDATISLDRSAVPAVLTSDLTGVAEQSAINRAIGVLLDQGHHPDQTHRELSRRADDAGVPDATYATQLVHRLARPEPPPVVPGPPEDLGQTL